MNPYPNDRSFTRLQITRNDDLTLPPSAALICRGGGIFKKGLVVGDNDTVIPGGLRFHDNVLQFREFSRWVSLTGVPFGDAVENAVVTFADNAGNLQSSNAIIQGSDMTGLNLIESQFVVPPMGNSLTLDTLEWPDAAAVAAASAGQVLELNATKDGFVFSGKLAGNLTYVGGWPGADRMLKTLGAVDTVDASNISVNVNDITLPAVGSFNTGGTNTLSITGNNILGTGTGGISISSANNQNIALIPNGMGEVSVIGSLRATVELEAPVVTSTGALTVSSGAGDVTLSPSNEIVANANMNMNTNDITNGGTATFTQGTFTNLTAGVGTVTLNSLLWPAADGAAGTFLTTNGAGTLGWASAGGGLTFPIFAPDSGAGAPSYSWSAHSTAGIYYDPSGPSFPAGNPEMTLISDNDSGIGTAITLLTRGGAGAGDPGGAINLTCGNGVGTGPGGNVNITGGNGTGFQSDGGRVRITTGATSGTDAGDRSGHLGLVIGSSASPANGEVGEVVMATLGTADGIHLIATQANNSSADFGIATSSGTVTTNSSDMAGHIAGAAGGVTVTFARRYRAAPFVVVSPDTAGVTAAVTATTISNFTVNLSAGSGFYYHVIGGEPNAPFPPLFP